jgi:hypothetical protein
LKQAGQGSFDIFSSKVMRKLPRFPRPSSLDSFLELLLGPKGVPIKSFWMHQMEYQLARESQEGMGQLDST